MADAGDELIDYEDEEETTTTITATAGQLNSTASKTGDAAKDGAASVEKGVKKGYVGIHSTGFRDFLLKPELLRAIADCGFEHPSEGAPAGVRAKLTFSPSAARVHPTGPPGDGRHFPSQERDGQDCRVCTGNATAD